MLTKKQPIVIDGQSSEDFENSRTLKDSKWLAHRLGVSYEKARQMGRRKEVPSIRVGRLIRYSPSAIDEWLTANMSPARAK